MKLFFTTAFLLVAEMCFAQRQNVYFLKNNGQHLKLRDSADYVRIVREPDSGSVFYKVFEFYLNGEKKLIGQSTEIDPPKFEGQCITYYKNGYKQQLSNYKDNRKINREFEFYPNGKPYLVKKYPDKPTDVYNDFTSDYLIDANYDSLGVAQVIDGNGYYKKYNDKFDTIVDEGKIKDGKRDGQWQGVDQDLLLKFIENYSDGTLISGVSIGRKGDSVNYSGSRSIPPQFKGGLNAFYEYLGKNINYPNYDRRHNIEGKVILTFIVEKSGKIADIKLCNSVSQNIDNEAIRCLMQSPNWMPGIKYGRKVRVVYTIPINFALKD